MPGKYEGMSRTRKLPAGTEQEAAAAAPQTKRTIGRPSKGQSKTDNADFRVTTFRASVDVIADADANLQKLRIGKDRSDLLNHLMAKWNQSPEPF